MILDQTHLFETDKNIPELNDIHFEGENQDRMNIRELQDLLDKVEKLGAKENSIVLNMPKGFLGFYERDWAEKLTIPECIKKIVIPGSFIGFTATNNKIDFLPYSKENKLFQKGNYAIFTDKGSTGFRFSNTDECKNALKNDDDMWSLWNMPFPKDAVSCGSLFKINRVTSLENYEFLEDDKILESHDLEILNESEVSFDGIPVSLERIYEKAYCRNVHMSPNDVLITVCEKAYYGITYESADGFSMGDILINEEKIYETQHSETPSHVFFSIKMSGEIIDGQTFLGDSNHAEISVLFKEKIYKSGDENELLSDIADDDDYSDDDYDDEEDYDDDYFEDDEEDYDDGLFEDDEDDDEEDGYIETFDGLVIKDNVLTAYRGYSDKIIIPPQVTEIADNVFLFPVGSIKMSDKNIKVGINFPWDKVL